MAEIRRVCAAILAVASLCAQAAAPQSFTSSADPLAMCRLAAQAPRHDVALGIPRAPFRLKATGAVRFTGVREAPRHGRVVAAPRPALEPLVKIRQSSALW